MLKLLILLLCIFFGSVVSQIDQRPSFGQNFVLLNCEIGGDQTGQELQTSHYISLPINFGALTNGFTMEIWLLWRGGEACSNLFFVNCDPRTPLFLVHKDTSNYLFLTPSTDLTLGGSPGNKYGTPELSISSTGFQGNFSWTAPPTRDFPVGIATWTHFSLSFDPNTNQMTWIVATMLDSQTPQVDTSTQTHQVTGFDPTSWGNVNLYIGSHDTTNPPPPGTAQGFLRGHVGDFRLWNRPLSASEVEFFRFQSLNPVTQNLVHNYLFNENSGPAIFDSVSQEQGELRKAPTDTEIIRVSNANDYTTYSFLDYRTLFTFNTFKRIVDWNGNSIVQLRVVGGASGDVTFAMNPSYSNIQISNPCLSDACSVQLTPSRGTCGTNVSIEFQQDSQTLHGVFLVGQTPVPSIVNPHTSSTLGTTLQYTATNLGILGAFVSGEYARIIVDGVTIDCTHGSVANQISCVIPPGVGANGTMEISSCKHVVSIPNVFSYQPPTISLIQGLNSSIIEIRGSNFGVSASRVSVTISQGSTSLPCIVNNINHTSIQCDAGQVLTSGEDYLGRVVAGGQSSDHVFTFNICEIPCVNGRCSGLNECNCDGTPFTGPTCAEAVACNPQCKNGGVCIFTAGSNYGTCNCPDGYSGIDCNSTSKNVLPIALGVAGGVLCIIIILIILVIIFVKKQKKRYKGDLWVPLEKKDFTKIIYGEQLGENVEKNAGELKTLDQLLLEDNMKLVSIISQLTQITEADKIAKAFVIIFQDHDKVLELLEKFISDEVEATEHAGNLFRSNSMVSKMFKFYSRLIGLPYLYLTIGPEITELIADELGLEVDPEKMEEGADLDEMRWTLMAQSQKILKQILNSSERCPAQFRRLFVHIEKAVKGRYPDNVRTTIGGFIFLRFFCPAVSSPEAYGIVEDPPSASSRRLLILITKVLQNLSNDVEFGSKEPYMTKMNDFVHANRDKLGKFYDKLLKSDTKDPVQVRLPKNVKNVSLSVISQHIRSILDKIEDKELRGKLDQIVAKD